MIVHLDETGFDYLGFNVDGIEHQIATGLHGRVAAPSNFASQLAGVDNSAPAQNSPVTTLGEALPDNLGGQ